MPIFGQVWLWSLLAFLLGALLCWALLVLPVRRRLDALESRLSAMRADATVGASRERTRADQPPSSPRGMVPGFDDTGSQDEIRADMLTRAYAPDIPRAPYQHDEAEERGALSLSAGGTLAEPTHAPEPTADPTQYIGAHSAPLVEPGDETPPSAAGSGRDWFDEEPGAQRHGDHHLVDDDDADERGTIFTQRTTPIPAEVIRQIDEAGKAAAADDSLVDDLDDEPAAPPSAPAPPPPPPAADADVPAESAADSLPKRTPQHSVDAETRQFERLPERVEPPAAATLDSILAGDDSGPARSDVDMQPPAPEPEPEPVARREEPIALVIKPNNRHTIEPRVMHGASVEPDLSQSVLPKRVPSKPQHRAPFGVQTVSPAGAHAAQGGERIRSLFEPMVPAESEQPAVPPPPHRLRAAAATATATATHTRPSAPGPFGPGSAMPLPGGASPSPEFTVKASVTALRYCTPESPQFGRTVAEVWFRSAADAERVGFRPVGS